MTGQAAARGTFEERRNARLNEMVEEAEVVITLRLDGTQLTMSMLARDDPPDEKSLAVAFAAFLSANWKELTGQMAALHTSWLAGAHEARSDLNQGMVIVNSRGLPANEEAPPVILDANGRVMRDLPVIELPASVAQEMADERPVSGEEG